MGVAENEPMAEMLVKRLREAGIPCYWRSGPLWPTYWNPSAKRELIINAADFARAKELLRAGGHPHHQHPRRLKRRRPRRRNKY